MKKQLNSAMADRNSMLSMLTPEQRAQIMTGLKSAQAAAGQLVTNVTGAINAPAPISTPLSGSYYRRF